MARAQDDLRRALHLYETGDPESPAAFQQALESGQLTPDQWAVATFHLAVLQLALGAPEADAKRQLVAALAVAPGAARAQELSPSQRPLLEEARAAQPEPGAITIQQRGNRVQLRLSEIPEGLLTRIDVVAPGFERRLAAADATIAIPDSVFGDSQAVDVSVSATDMYGNALFSATTRVRRSVPRGLAEPADLSPRPRRVRIGVSVAAALVVVGLVIGVGVAVGGGDDMQAPPRIDW